MAGVIQRSFAGGELAPALHARADQAKYLTGLRTCRNFLVHREGGVSNRAGTRFVEACRTNSATVQLMRYVSEVEGESILIENGNGYLRFFRNGAAVEVAGAPAWDSGTDYAIGDIVSVAGVNYYSRTANTNQAPASNADDWYPMPGALLELPSPFGSNLPNWDSQDGNTLTLTKRGSAPYELIYLGVTSWVLRPLTTAPAGAAPTGLAGTVGATGSRTYTYRVTAAAPETYEESYASGSFAITGAGEPTADDPHTLTWNVPAGGAAEYYVYLDPYGNGIYGYIGTASGNSFADTGFVPDFAVTPPLPAAPFANPDDYPDHSAVYQQRRFLANTNRHPDGIWASRTGFPLNFAISSPLQDDDALTFRIAGNNNHPIRHLVGLKTLVALTGGGEWSIGEPRTPLTPGNIPIDQETYAGVADLRPVVLGNAIVYVQARKKIVRDLRFDQQVEGLGGRDLLIYAAHLLKGKTIRRIDYQQNPDSTVWAVRSDGVLLGLTYVPEHEVWGWHRHDTAQNATTAAVEDVCVVPETSEDVVYLIVRRTIDGATVRYIERLEDREIVTWDEDVFFVDCGLSYSGTPANNFSGLDHLEGQVVAVVGDGAVVFNGDPAASNAASFTVTDGEITLGADYSNVHIGLAIRYADIETLDLDVQGSDVRGKRKRVNGLKLLLESSARTFWSGPDASSLRQFIQQDFDLPGDAFTGQVELNLTSEFNDYGRVYIRQIDPLPLTIVGAIPQAELGGS